MSNSSSEEDDFYVAGVGTSAGGIDALTKMLDSFNGTAHKLCIIIAQHLSPTHKSELTSILSRHCKWPVLVIEDGMRVEPHTIYVTPQNKKIIYANKTLALDELAPHYSYAPSIDEFLISLAENEKQYAIGIILSGTAHDGTKGIKAVKANGGFTIAQSPDSAQYDSMPLSAIQTNQVDAILHPANIYDEITYYIKNHRVVKAIEPSKKGIDVIFDLLSKRSGVDFSQYKQNTILRRIDKRIEALRLTSLENYYQVIRQKPSELDKLFDTVLIGVTEFFRDLEAFNLLRDQLEPFLQQKKYNESIRIWCVGCATGEEPYSIAILVHELLGSEIANYQLQIFASDIDEKALSVARKGVYMAKSLEKVAPDIVEKYFDKTDQGFEVKKVIKQYILFSRHDITNDPPFVKLDLVVCRNLLIYFNNALQKEAFRIFNYSLKEDGLLFLGKSESVSVANDLFAKLENGKIFRKIEAGIPHNMRFSRFRTKLEVDQETAKANRKMSLADIAKETLYHANESPFVIINQQGEIKEAQGSLRLYMEMSQGSMNANILKMANKELVMEIRSLLIQVKKLTKPLTSTIIRFIVFDTEYFVRLKLIPLIYPANGSQHHMLLFESIAPDSNLVHFTKDRSAKDFEDYRIKELEQEIILLREHLQTFTEELETSNEEMQAVNEELQSANEELKSSNEELETSNEELQSTNEELHTANGELRLVNQQLIEKEAELKKAHQESANNELLYRTIAENIPNGTIGILNNKFCIEYVAGRGLAALNIQSADVIGKCLPELNPSETERQKLVDVFLRTLQGESCTTEFQYHDRSYSLQTIPFQYALSTEMKIMYLTQDITEEKNQEALLKNSEIEFHMLADNIPVLCWMAKADGWIYWYNSRWYEFTGTTLEQMEGWGWQSVHDQTHIDSVQEKWQTSIAVGESFEMVFPLKRHDGVFRSFLTRIIPLRDEEGRVIKWFGTNTDITEQNQMYEELATKNEKLVRMNNDMDNFIYSASHDLKSPIINIEGLIQAFLRVLPPESIVSEKPRHIVSLMQESVQRFKKTINSLTQIVKLEKEELTVPVLVDLSTIIREVMLDMETIIQATGAQVEIDIANCSEVYFTDKNLRSVVYNLLSNAIKYHSPDRIPRIRLHCQTIAPYQVLTVTDNGLGMEDRHLKQLFTMFKRFNTDVEGSGIGLYMIKKMIENANGHIEVESQLGVGSTFRVYFRADNNKVIA